MASRDSLADRVGSWAAGAQMALSDSPADQAASAAVGAQMAPIGSHSTATHFRRVPPVASASAADLTLWSPLDFGASWIRQPYAQVAVRDLPGIRICQKGW